MDRLVIDEIGYIEEIRQRMGLDENDTSADEEIEYMEPMERVRLLAGFYHGNDDWADTWKEYFESQGIYLTTNSDVDGII